MMASRKTVLDKNKKELLDSVNASNKVYSNEELSILVGELQTKVNTLEQENSTLTKELTDYKVDNDKKVNDMFSRDSGNIRTFTLTKFITGDNGSSNEIILNNIVGPVVIEVKICGSYQNINYGGYVIYRMGAVLVNNSSFNAMYGYGDYGERKGAIGECVGIMTSTYSGSTLRMKIPFTGTAGSGKGSNVRFDITIHADPDSIPKITAEMN